MGVGTAQKLMCADEHQLVALSSCYVLRLANPALLQCGCWLSPQIDVESSRLTARASFCVKPPDALAGSLHSCRHCPGQGLLYAGCFLAEQQLLGPGWLHG